MTTYVSGHIKRQVSGFVELIPYYMYHSIVKEQLPKALQAFEPMYNHEMPVGSRWETIVGYDSPALDNVLRCHRLVYDSLPPPIQKFVDNPAARTYLNSSLTAAVRVGPSTLLAMEIESQALDYHEFRFPAAITTGNFGHRNSSDSTIIKVQDTFPSPPELTMSKNLYSIYPRLSPDHPAYEEVKTLTEKVLFIEKIAVNLHVLCRIIDNDRVKVTYNQLYTFFPQLCKTLYSRGIINEEALAYAPTRRSRMSGQLQELSAPWRSVQEATIRDTLPYLAITLAEVQREGIWRAIRTGESKSDKHGVILTAKQVSFDE